MQRQSARGQDGGDRVPRSGSGDGETGVPLYFYHLRSDRRVADPQRSRGAGRERAHARGVARELMRGCEPSTRTGRLDVFDRNGDFCFGLLFASVDDSIARWAPDIRSHLETFCRSKASFVDAVDQVRASVLQLKSTLGGWAEDSSRWPATATLLRPPVDRPLDRRARSSPDGARFLLICVPPRT